MALEELADGLWRASRASTVGERRRCVLIAIPAFNEERYIGSLVLQARLMGLAVLVIDDGSTDRTAELAEAAGAAIARHPANLGKAAALNTAFQWAREQRAEALVVLDGDGQHDVREIEPLIEKVWSGEADIVIGSRFLAESSGEIPGLRRLGQRAMTALTNAGSGVSVSDSQSGFRAFSRRAIEAILFRTRGFSVEVETQFLAREYDLKVVEVPITAVYHAPPKRNVLGHGVQVLNGVLGLVGRHRPLLFFGYPGLVMLLAGLILGSRVVDIYQQTLNLAVGYGLVTVLLVIGGLLATFTGILLHSIRGTFLDLEQRIARLDGLGAPTRTDGR